jgi:hypothetical protein
MTNPISHVTPGSINTSLPKDGVHPKIVSEKLGRVNISNTLDIYNHVFPGLPETMVVTVDVAKMGR